MTNSFSKIVTKVSAASTAAYISAVGMVNTVSAGDDVTTGTDAQGNVTLNKGYARDVGSLITSLLTFVMLIAALLILMYLIWGGIQWITSGGDKGKTEEARNKITSAVIGLIILAAAWAVFLIVLRFLGFGGYDELFTNITSIDGGTTSAE